MKRFLIINADDLGMSPEINAGILSGLYQGCISDTSLMASGPCAASAARDLLTSGRDHAGIHIDLDPLFGWKPGGRERHSRADLMKLFEEGEFLDACTREIRDQIVRFLDFKLIPTHIDTHHHVHGFPAIFSLLLEMAAEYQVPAMRFSRAGYRLPTRTDIPYDPGTFLSMEKALRGKGLFFPDHYLENASSLKLAKGGITELVVHPSLSGDRWRMEELHFLMSEEGVQRLDQEEIGLVSYQEALDFRPVHQGNDSGKSG
jgi:predicted glycoside hydrolase/deacetylase ChbG (UPF0249 family)